MSGGRRSRSGAAQAAHVISCCLSVRGAADIHKDDRKEGVGYQHVIW